MDQLRQQLLHKSAGVLPCAFLVIPRLYSIGNQGRGSTTILREQGSVPKSLHNALASILSRDADNLDNCITLIRWVLFSLRPLRPVGLNAAVQHTCSLRTSTVASPLQSLLWPSTLHTARAALSS